MRKLKLETEGLVVESFDPVVFSDGQKGTVHANATEFEPGCTFDEVCTRNVSCHAELCWEQPTNDPRYRQCYTPYVECSTEGYTCNWQCGAPTGPPVVCGGE